MSEDKEKDKQNSESRKEADFPTLSRIEPIEELGTKIGQYKLLSVLGGGGFGMVYLADQKGPIKRKVALKVIKPGMDSKQVIARFDQERQTLASLDHPNIAHIYDGGTTESGHPYFVMEFVRGLPITEYCDRHELTIEKRLELFRQVCEAVQHAHQKGIIHRDIKPSNILVKNIKPFNPSDSVPEEKPVPIIIDFGIAKAINQPLTEKTLHTEEGQFIGTPEYMSPEQAENSIEGIDTRSDIYSLGVVLYELLIGTLPFTREELCKAGMAEIQRVIRESDPPKPSTRLSSLGEEAKKIAEKRKTKIAELTKRMQKELEWIPLKAMRKEPDRRYKTASELAYDVKNYLNGDPLIAGPESRTYRLKKTLKRHRVVVGAVVAVLVVLVTGIIVSSIFAARAIRAESAERSQRITVEKALNEAEQAKDAEQKQREIAEQQAEEYRRILYVNRINLAEKYYGESNISRVRELLRACPKDLRGWEWYYLWRISDQSRMTLRGHEGRVRSVAFSPDGTRIVSGSYDNTLKVWDAESGSEVMTLRGHKDSGVFIIFQGIKGSVTSVAFSPDGTRIVSGSYDNTLKVWDAESGSEVMTLRGHEGPVTSVAFSPDGTRIVSGSSGSSDNTIKVWDADSGSEVMTLRRGRREVRLIAFSPDGRRLVSAADNSNVPIVLDANSGNNMMGLQGHGQRVTSVAFSPDGRRIVSGSVDRTLKVWNANNGVELMTLRGHRQPVTSVALSPDGKRIVSGSDDGTLKVWDAENGSEVMTLWGHEGRVNSVAFSPNGEWIVSGSDDNKLKVWDDNSGSEVMAIRGVVAVSPDGERIILDSMDNTLKVWDTDSGNELVTLMTLMTLRGIRIGFLAFAFSPDGRRIVFSHRNRSINVRDTESGDALMPLRGHESSVTSVAFSHDGRRIVSGSNDNTLKVWDANSSSELMTFRGHENNVYPNSVAFSPDDRRIVSAGMDGTIRVWDVNSGSELLTLRGDYSVAFSPDGRRIISGSVDDIPKIWDADSGREVMTLPGHENNVTSVAFSPDGRRIATGSYDQTIKVWDAESGRELMTLRGHEANVTSVAFSPDGRRIVSRSSDQTIKVWFAADPEEVAAEQLAEEKSVSWVRNSMPWQKVQDQFRIIDDWRLQASKPQPAHGTMMNIAYRQKLSWVLGIDATAHNVYFGSKEDAVKNATTTSPEYKGSLELGNESYNPGKLDLDTTYYWRIDEVNEINPDSPWKGSVWSFTTTDSQGRPKGRACFINETGVWIKGTLIPISKINKGLNIGFTDYDSAPNSLVRARSIGNVEEIQEHEGEFECYDILLESGNCISVAECHYFLEETGGWIALQNLKLGTRLKTSKGSVGIISVVKRPKPYKGKVYNLKIQGSDQYFVGEDAVIVRDF